MSLMTASSWRVVRLDEPHWLPTRTFMTKKRCAVARTRSREPLAGSCDTRICRLGEPSAPQPAHSAEALGRLPEQVQLGRFETRRLQDESALGRVHRPEAGQQLGALLRG